MNSEKEKIAKRIMKVCQSLTPEQYRYFKKYQDECMEVKGSFQKMTFIVDRIKQIEDMKIGYKKLQDLHRLEIKYIKLEIIEESSR